MTCPLYVLTLNSLNYDYECIECFKILNYDDLHDVGVSSIFVGSKWNELCRESYRLVKYSLALYIKIYLFDLTWNFPSYDSFRNNIQIT